MDSGDTAGLVIPELDPDFLKFLKQIAAERAPDGGWVVEGDIHFVDTRHLYETFLGKEKSPASAGSAQANDGITPRSTVICQGDDFDGTWDIHEKLRVTYPLGAFPDEILRTHALRGLRRALRQIERTTDVNYVLIPTSTPEDCETLWKAGSVFYIVRQALVCDGALEPTAGSAVFDCDCVKTDDEDCDAYGFGTYPSFAPEVAVVSGHRLVFFQGMKSKPNDDGGPQSTVVHEIGHTVGLYHEQARFEQAGIQANNNCAPKVSHGPWRGVAPPDGNSIMGYRHCDGINQIGVADFSAGDRQGLSYLYSIPRLGATRLDAGPTDDVFWVQPSSDVMTAWFGGSNMQGDIIFTTETVTLPVALSRHVKPTPVRVSSPQQTDILLYEPGSKSEIFIKRDGGNFDAEILLFAQNERHAIPLVGTFLGGAGVEDVWWWLAGPDGSRSDDMWMFAQDASFTVNSAYDDSFSADNYARPLVGTWITSRGSGLPNSQIIWYREQNLRVRHLFQDGTMFSFAGDTSNQNPACGLVAGREYRPLVGNFDGEPENEILWVTPDSEQQVIWWDLSSMWADGGSCTSANQGVFTFPNAGFYKPFVGDFDNNGVDDVFWYSGGPLPPNPDNPLDLGPIERVWFMGGGAILEELNFVQMGDYSPYVGDFDGNGCEDILWFAPHQTTSPLWRANCVAGGERGFVVQADVTHPPLAYPVGYYPTRGRK